MPRQKRTIEERLAAARTRRDAAEEKVQALQAQMDAFEQAAFAALGRAVVKAEQDAGNADFVLMRYLPAIKAERHRAWLEGRLRPTTDASRDSANAEPRATKGAQPSESGTDGGRTSVPEAADTPPHRDKLGDKVVSMASPFPDVDPSDADPSGLYGLLRAVEKANG